MPTDMDPNNLAWTIATLIILFGMIPAILFLLGKAATAGAQPDIEQMGEARHLAVQINHAAEKLLTDATHAFVGIPGERQALDALIQLADTAERFRVLILDPVRSPGRTRRAYRELVVDFEHARLASPALQAFGSGPERIERLRRLIEELKRLYDAQPTQTPLSESTLITIQKAERQNENLKIP
jgi:hypothetical protein